MHIKVGLLNETLVLLNEEWGKKGYTSNYLLVLNNVVSVDKGKHSFDKLVLYILEECYCIDSSDVVYALDNSIKSIEVNPTSKFNELSKGYSLSDYSSFLASERNKVQKELNFPYKMQNPINKWDAKYYKINDNYPINCTSSQLLPLIKSEHRAEDWFINFTIKRNQFIVVNKDTLRLTSNGVSYGTRSNAEKDCSSEDKIIYLP